jgi:hypothetical protein
MKIISMSVSIFNVAIKVMVLPEPGGPHSKKGRCAEPAAKNFLMPASVDRVDDGAGIDHLTRLNLNLWHSLSPHMPLLVIDSDFIVQKC